MCIDKYHINCYKKSISAPLPHSLMKIQTYIISGLVLALFLACLGITHSFAVENVHVSNTATVQNSVTTTCGTGNNTVTGNGTIKTGNANCQTVIQNVVNTNIVVTSPTPTQTPTLIPTLTITSSPTPTPTPGQNGCTSNCGGNNSGGSNNNSGGSSNNSSSNTQSTSPAQAVLGTSDMAATGTFTNTLMAMFAFVGFGFLFAGSYNLRKDLVSK